jgi:deoxyribonuclease IV
MRIGIHARTGGSIASAVAYAAGVGAECVQVFAKSPQRWHAPAIDPEAAAEARRLVRELDAGPLFTHTAYLINLGSADDELWRRSIRALADELRRGRVLDAAGVVTHIGTNAFGDVGEAVERIADGVAEACRLAEETGGLLLLENTAGAGRSFGGSYEELAAVFSALDERGVTCGLCLDTCHAHAYGHDLSSAAAWTKAVDAIEASCGRERLRLLHANDCAYPLGSRRDRHAWIGEGAIGAAGFEAMVCEERLERVPAIMEMPGEAPDKDVINLDRLKSARDVCA